MSKYRGLIEYRAIRQYDNNLVRQFLESPIGCQSVAMTVVPFPNNVILSNVQCTANEVLYVTHPAVSFSTDYPNFLPAYLPFRGQQLQKHLFEAIRRGRPFEFIRITVTKASPF